MERIRETAFRFRLEYDKNCRECTVKIISDAPDVDLKVTNQKLKLHNKIAKVATKVVAPWQAFDFGNIK